MRESPGQRSHRRLTRARSSPQLRPRTLSIDPAWFVHVNLHCCSKLDGQGIARVQIARVWKGRRALQGHDVPSRLAHRLLVRGPLLLVTSTASSWKLGFCRSCDACLHSIVQIMCRDSGHNTRMMHMGWDRIGIPVTPIVHPGVRRGSPEQGATG